MSQGRHLSSHLSREVRGSGVNEGHCKHSGPSLIFRGLQTPRLWFPPVPPGKGVSAVHPEDRISLGSRLGETALPPCRSNSPSPSPQWRQQTNHTAGRWGKGEPQAAPSLHLHCKGSSTDSQEGFQLLPPPCMGVQLPLTKGSAPAGGRLGAGCWAFPDRPTFPHRPGRLEHQGFGFPRLPSTSAIC